MGIAVHRARKGRRGVVGLAAALEAGAAADTLEGGSW